ncbi:MAG TPA: outer membrane protein transport protein [Gemmatimonadaceae bacterium]|nr:outer membrane protein transport protein [Gemmatimonadaceae bacterium]
MQWHRSMRSLAVLVSLVCAPIALRAQGFGVNEIGTCATSRAFAVTGSPCKDASVIFWNPGAAATLKGWNVLAGGALIQLDAKFTQDTTFREFEGDNPLAFVPHVFVNYKPDSGFFSLNGKAAWGLGVYVPYGLTSQWTDSFPGRFLAKRADLRTVYIQPNVAYQLNDKWFVGGGPVIGISSVELVQSLDLSQQVASGAITFAQLGIAKRTEFARARLNGDNFAAFGAQIGVFGKPNADWTVGLRFLTPLEFDYEGATATFTQVPTNLVLPPNNPIAPGSTVQIDQLVAPQFAAGGRLVDQGVSTKITHPAQIQAGFGYNGFKDWILSADYVWVGWRRFKELPIEFLGPANVSNRALIEDYNNTSAIRLAAQRQFTGGAQVRLGFSGVASAAPDETVTPLLPEQDRAYITIGGEYPFMKKYAVEAGYLHAYSPGKRGRIDERANRGQTGLQLNTGKYDLSANVLSISLKANF